MVDVQITDKLNNRETEMVKPLMNNPNKRKTVNENQKILEIKKMVCF